MPPRKSTKTAVDRGIERVLEEAPAIIGIRRGPEHRFVFVNRKMRDSLDGRPLLGRPFAEAFPELVPAGFVKLLDQVYDTGVPYVANGRRADVPEEPGGAPVERYWNMIYQPTRGEDGSVDGVSSFAFDVTDHVKARRESEQARRQYDDLVDALGIVVWRVDPEGWRPSWVRGHVMAVMGVEPEAALDPTVWWERVHPEDLGAVCAARDSLAAPGIATASSTVTALEPGVGGGTPSPASCGRRRGRSGPVPGGSRRMSRIECFNAANESGSTSTCCTSRSLRASGCWPGVSRTTSTTCLRQSSEMHRLQRSSLRRDTRRRAR